MDLIYTRIKRSLFECQIETEPAESERAARPFASGCKIAPTRRALALARRSLAVSTRALSVFVFRSRRAQVLHARYFLLLLFPVRQRVVLSLRPCGW